MADTFLARLFGKDEKESKNDTQETKEQEELPAFTGPAAIHNPDSRWDRQNKPVGYIIGASPGFAQFAQGEEKLASTGLGRKIAKASRMGFDFAMIDYEALSEMYEPDLKDLIRRINKAPGNEAIGRKFEVGVHLPTDIDLCIANAFQWTQMQEKLIRGAYSSAALVGARFYLFHTSSNIRPHVTFKVGQQEPRVAQVSHDGINLGDFMVDLDETKYKDPKTGNHGDLKSKLTPEGKNWDGMVDWYKAKFISVLFNVMGAAGDPALIGYLERGMIEDKFYGLKSGKERIKIEYNKLAKDAWEKVKEQEKALFDKELNDAYADKNTIELKLKELEERLKNTSNSQDAQQLTYDLNNLKQKHNNFSDFIANKKNELEAIMNSEQMVTLFLDPKTRETIQQNILNRLETEFLVILNGGKDHPKINPQPSYEHYRSIEKIRELLEYYDFDTIFDFWKNHGSECEERVSYHVIAKYLWLTQDKFWVDIVGGEYEPDKILKRADEGKEFYYADGHGKTVDDLVENLITAVASKYIQGHLFTTDPTRDMRSLPEQRIREHVTKVKTEIAGDQNCEKATSVYWYTRFNKIMIYIETAMPPQGQEGQLRVMSANDHVRLVKHLDGGEYTSYTMDFEHLMDNFIDPGTDIKALKDGDGKYITMLHINAPRPVMGTHAPLDLISHDQYLLYVWMYDLKQKGMDNAYVIWEMGSFGSRESATAFRRLVDCLRKNQHYNNLPNEFFGIDETFEAQQHVAIREHAYDPLEGVLMIPEESHTLLSSAAKEKGKLAEWARERFR